MNFSATGTLKPAEFGFRSAVGRLRGADQSLGYADQGSKSLMMAYIGTVPRCIHYRICCMLKTFCVVPNDDIIRAINSS